MDIQFIFAIIVLIMSVVVHELSHGYAAYFMGDPTARLAGRLTLNPVKHLDPVGSLIVPTLAYMIGGFIIGWAKPVPYNPYNLSDKRWGTAFVAVAGALSNLFIAIIFGLLIRFSSALGIETESFINIASIIVFINIILAIFNLIPIPPLDGSKVLFSVLPYRLDFVREFLERYWLVFIFLLLFFFGMFIVHLVFLLFMLLTGVGVGI